MILLLQTCVRNLGGNEASPPALPALRPLSPPVVSSVMWQASTEGLTPRCTSWDQCGRQVSLHSTRQSSPRSLCSVSDLHLAGHVTKAPPHTPGIDMWPRRVRLIIRSHFHASCANKHVHHFCSPKTKLCCLYPDIRSHKCVRGHFVCVCLCLCVVFVSTQARDQERAVD